MKPINLKNFDNSEYSRGVHWTIEAAWMLIKPIVFMHSFPFPSRLKVLILCLFGAKVGRGVVIRSRVNISMPWKVQIRDNVWIGDDVCILSLALVTIGANSCVSQRAFLCTGSHDFDKESFDLIVKPISIGESCWVGAQSFVGPGVNMGASSRCLAVLLLLAIQKQGRLLPVFPLVV